MRACKYVYLDVDGNPSSIYYDTLKKYGQEAAERAYVSYMLSTDAKFSVDKRTERTAVDDIIGEAEDLKLSGDETRYVSRRTGEEWSRITDTVKNLKLTPNESRTARILKPEFDDVAISEEMAKKEIEDIVIANSKNSVSRQDPAGLERALKTYLEKNPDVTIADRAAFIRGRWEAGTSWGDFFHAMFQEFFTLRGTDLDADPKPFIGKAINNVRDRFPDIDSSELTGRMVSVIYQVDDFVKKIKEEEKLRYGDEPEITIAPELKLRSKSLEKNVAGTSDLVIFTNNGNAYILDFKTKSESSAKNMFRPSTGRFGGPFASENLDDNPANSARVQMAYYAAILEEHGYKVPATYTVMIEGDLQRNPTKDTWRFVGLKKPQILSSATLHHLLKNDAPEKLEELQAFRKSGIDGFVQEVSSDGDHHNMRYVSDNEDNAVNVRKLGVQTDKQGRRFIYRENPMLSAEEHKYYIDNKSEAEIDKTLRTDYRITKEERLNVANDVIQFFENAGVEHGSHKLTHREKIVGTLLGGISKHTHTLERADRYDPSIGDAGADILVATNKQTGAISLFSVVTAGKSKIQFANIPGGKRSTIFGKYANDRVVGFEKAGSEIFADNSSHDYHALKLGLVALKIKNKSPKPILIENMKVGSILGGDAGSVTTTYIAKEITKLKMLYKYMPDDVKQKYEFVGKLLSKPSNTADESYGMDAVAHFKHMILNASGTLKDATNYYDIGRIIDERVRTLKLGSVLPYSLITDLVKFRREYTSILESRELPVEGNDVLLAIDKALLQLSKIQVYSKQVMRGRFSKEFLRTAMTSGDYFTQRAQVLYNSASSKIRQEFQDFDKLHKDKLEDFINESNRYGLSNINEVFKSIYADPNFTDGNQENWMKLKSVDDPTLRDRPAAREYIKFFNSTVEAQLERSMSKRQFNGVKSGATWAVGAIPIIRATKSLADVKNWKSVGAMTDAIKSNIKAMEKAGFDPQLSNTFDFNKMEHFVSQATERGAIMRNEMMGLTGPLKVVPSRDLETNLAAILNNMVVTTSEAEHMGNTLMIVDASLSNVFDEMAKYNPDIDTEDTRKYLKGWTSMVINNKYGKDSMDENDKIPRYMDAVSKAASTAYFSGSTKQATTEFLTGTFQTGSAMIANVITGLMSKGETVRFWPQDVAWAASCLDGKFDVDLQSKAFQITFDLGMTYADPAQLKQKEFYDTGKAKLFRSRPMFYLNQLFFNSSITNTALAEIHHKGIDKAYVNVGTDKKQEWKYDETLDERFYVYSPEGESYGSKMKSVPPQTEEDKKKYALWKAVKAELIEEGMVSEDNRMKVPLTANERTSIKFYATKLYGSFNKDKTKQEEMHAVGRAMLRYKDWFAQRIANYYTPTDMSIARGKFEWVADPELEDGGYMQWKGIPNEGIIETVGGIFKELIETQKVGKLNEVQLENLGKLFADIILMLMLMWPVATILDKNKDSKFLNSKTGKALVRAYTNAISDIAIWQSASTMGDTMFPGVDMAITTALDGTKAAFSLATGDPDAAMKSFTKVPEKVGIYNSLSSMYESIFN